MRSDQLFLESFSLQPSVLSYQYHLESPRQRQVGNASPLLCLLRELGERDAKIMLNRVYHESTMSARLVSSYGSPHFHLHSKN